MEPPAPLIQLRSGAGGLRSGQNWTARRAGCLHDAVTDTPASLFYLVGPPAVGKLTIARELERRTGAIVVDNHLWSDAAFVPLGLKFGADWRLVDDLREEIRERVLLAAERAPRHLSHVFTHWLPDDPENAAILDGFRALAQRRGATFRPVWLTADADVLARRVTEPDRTVKAKLTDPDVLRELLAEPLLPAPPDALVLDTTDLTPAQAVDAILANVPD